MSYIISFDISDGRYSINTTGSFDQWVFELQNINEASETMNARWNFYNNSDSLNISRPEIPLSVLSEYPDLNNISFSLYGHVEGCLGVFKGCSRDVSGMA